MSDQTEELVEVLERLKAAGLDPGLWGDLGGHGPKTPGFALRLSSNLTKLNAVLGAAMREKEAEVRLLEEKLLRLRLGGGS